MWRWWCCCCIAVNSATLTTATTNGLQKDALRGLTGCGDGGVLPAFVIRDTSPAEAPLPPSAEAEGGRGGVGGVAGVGRRAGDGATSTTTATNGLSEDTIAWVPVVEMLPERRAVTSAA